MSGPNNYPNTLLERLRNVQSRIETAARASGRDPSEIGLIAVTKTHPPESVAALFELGQMSVGENRAQEFSKKYEALEGQGDWHFVGHLQRNKVPLVVGRAALIHSADSERLIEAIQKQAERIGTRQDVLLEINCSGEARKTGAPPGEAPRLVEKLAGCSHVRGRGLMTMAPQVPDPEDARPAFARLRELMTTLESSEHFEPRHLSMGMSGDFEAAIAEGATLVRVGTAIMGDRLPKQA